ncbi:MAG: hypothetical protein KGZ96_04165 [Clostridia bacterium]|nr:hypothetical protein [Clostridia bacterium]
MFANFIILIMIIILIFIAVKIKISQLHKRSDFSKVSEEIRLSPFSRALTELIAIAGGIYISLSVLTSFLSLSVPQRIELAENLHLDPLAMIAIIITILQPIVLKIFYRVKI